MESKPLSQVVSELEELRKKATEGEWRADWDDNGQWYIEPIGLTGHGLRGDSCDCIESANANLIANLHNAAPRLLAATKLCEELRKALAWINRCASTGAYHALAMNQSLSDIGRCSYDALAKADAVLGKKEQV